LGVARIVRASITIVATYGNTGTTDYIVAGVGITLVVIITARRVVCVHTTKRDITRGGLASCVIVTRDWSVRATGGRVANICSTFVVVIARYFVVFTTIGVITRVVGAEVIIIAGNNGENTSGSAIAIGSVACIWGGTIDSRVSATCSGYTTIIGTCIIIVAIYVSMPATGIGVTTVISTRIIIVATNVNCLTSDGRIASFGSTISICDTNNSRV
jgi:hypothetical protein